MGLFFFLNKPIDTGDKYSGRRLELQISTCVMFWQKSVKRNWSQCKSKDAVFVVAWLFPHWKILALGGAVWIINLADKIINFLEFGYKRSLILNSVRQADVQIDILLRMLMSFHSFLLDMQNFFLLFVFSHMNFFFFPNTDVVTSSCDLTGNLNNSVRILGNSYCTWIQIRTAVLNQKPR